MNQIEKKEGDESGTNPQKDLRVDQGTVKDLAAKDGELVKGGIPPKLGPTERRKGR